MRWGLEFRPHTLNLLGVCKASADAFRICWYSGVRGFRAAGYQGLRLRLQVSGCGAAVEVISNDGFQVFD